jgi:hypothetical protein
MIAKVIPELAHGVCNNWNPNVNFTSYFIILVYRKTKINLYNIIIFNMMS